MAEEQRNEPSNTTVVPVDAAEPEEPAMSKEEALALADQNTKLVREFHCATWYFAWWIDGPAPCADPERFLFFFSRGFPSMTLRASPASIRKPDRTIVGVWTPREA